MQPQLDTHRPFTHPPLAVMPVVLDANGVISDVMRRATDGFTALSFLVERRVVAMVAPSSVQQEVIRRLPEVAMARGVVEPSAAFEIWETVYRPAVRFVDVPPGLPEDARVEAVEAVDPDDVPVGQLASLIAPTVVITSDKHLRQAGFGTDNWVYDILLLRKLAAADATLHGGFQATWLSTYLVALALKELAARIVRSEIALGITLGAVAFAAVELGPHLRAAPARAKETLASIALRGLASLNDMLDQRADVEAALGPRLVVPPPSPSALAVAVRALAVADAPLPARELQTALRAEGHPLSLHATRRLLTENGCFTALPGRGWQLGRWGEPSPNARNLAP